jgi:hypothetical protein
MDGSIKTNYMSRSKKLAIIKDKKDNTYWRRIRSRINQIVRQFKDEKINRPIFHMDNDCPEDAKILDSEDTIPNPKSLVNDYDYRDYFIDFEFNNLKGKQKYQRK